MDKKVIIFIFAIIICFSVGGSFFIFPLIFLGIILTFAGCALLMIVSPKWLVVVIAIIAIIFISDYYFNKEYIDEPIENSTLLTKLHGKVIYATYSVDGDYAIYKNLYVMDLDATPHNSQKLSEVKTSNELIFKAGYYYVPCSFVISPDRKKIAFFQNDGLWVLDIDTKNMKRIVEANQGGDHYIAWHPNGQSLAYVDGGDLYIVNANGTRHNKIVRHRFGTYTGVGRVEDQIRNPTWLFNGSVILFNDFPVPDVITKTKKGRFKIYVFDFEKNIANRFTDNFEFDDDLHTYKHNYLSIMPPSSNSPLYDEFYLSSGGDISKIAKFNWSKNKWEFKKECDYLYGNTFLLSSDEDIFLSLDPVSHKSTIWYYNHRGGKTLSLNKFFNMVLTGYWSPNNQYVALSGASNNKILILEPNSEHIVVLPIEQEDYVEVVAWVR